TSSSNAKTRFSVDSLICEPRRLLMYWQTTCWARPLAMRSLTSARSSSVGMKRGIPPLEGSFVFALLMARPVEQGPIDGPVGPACPGCKDIDISIIDGRFTLIFLNALKSGRTVVSDMFKQEPFDPGPFINNPSQRCPCALLLDVSGSMQGKP